MWRLIPGQRLVCRRWDDEAVLFNDLSGATHLLGLTAICLLDLLQASPAHESALIAALGRQFEADEDELIHEIGNTLAELQRLDLVEPC